MEVGQKVEIIDDFNGHDRHVGYGVVERVTKTQIVVRNSHGNTNKYRTKDLQVVGYAWPQVTYVIRAV